VTERRRRRGVLVAVEGIDGAGKSTLVRSLARAVRRQGFRVRVRREPSDATIGRLAQEVGSRDPWSGAVYFTVDRHLAAPRLERDLARYDLVLSDRSFYSTLAYQGSRLPSRERVRLEELQWAATIVPDQVLLLEMPVAWLERRIGERRAARGPLERSRWLGRAARSYRRLARENGWTVLDARAPPGAVAREAVRALRPRLDRLRPRRRS
jgi:dTMP kinase